VGRPDRLDQLGRRLPVDVFDAPDFLRALSSHVTVELRP
jgi:hypothetical protein